MSFTALARAFSQRRAPDGRDIGAQELRRAELAELVELDRRLALAAAHERAELARRAMLVEFEFSRGSNDLVGGCIDAERGSAVLRFARFDVVVATYDITELETLVRLAAERPVSLRLLRRASDDRFGLVFDIDGQWTVSVRAEVVLPALRDVA